MIHLKILQAEETPNLLTSCHSFFPLSWSPSIAHYAHKALLNPVPASLSDPISCQIPFS